MFFFRTILSSLWSFVCNVLSQYKTNTYSNDPSMLLQNVKTFKDVKGCDDAKKELEEVVEYLKNPSKFTRLGGKLPKVITLCHPACNNLSSPCSVSSIYLTFLLDD